MFPPPLNLVRNLFSIVALLSCCFPSAMAAPVSLELRKPLECSIGPGETHSYTLNINAGQYAHLVVDQRGVDVEDRALGAVPAAVAALGLAQALARSNDSVATRAWHDAVIDCLVTRGASTDVLRIDAG